MRDLLPAFAVGALWGLVAVLIAYAAQAAPRLMLAILVFVIACAVLTVLAMARRGVSWPR
jgi:uncharacterized membrane protein (Fun14 family)